MKTLSFKQTDRKGRPWMSSKDLNIGSGISFPDINLQGLHDAWLRLCWLFSSPCPWMRSVRWTASVNIVWYWSCGSLFSFVLSSVHPSFFVLCFYLSFVSLRMLWSLKAVRLYGNGLALCVHASAELEHAGLLSHGYTALVHGQIDERRRSDWADWLG